MFALDPDFLRTFIAISETGSYGAAGERVNKTQSTVSAQMRRLEEIVGVALFEKEGRRNVLTPEGRKLLEYAASMVRLNDEALKAFRPPEISGRVRVGAVDEYAQAFLPDALSVFNRTHSAVEVCVATGSSAQLRPLVDAGEIDAAIITCQSGSEAMEIIRSDRLHWIGPENGCVHLEKVLPLSVWSDGCSWREMGMAALARGGREWRLTFTTSNASLLGRTVRDGLGVTVAPEWFLTDGLRVLDDLDARYPLGRAEIGIKRRPGCDDPALEAFLAHLHNRMVRSLPAA